MKLVLISEGTRKIVKMVTLLVVLCMTGAHAVESGHPHASKFKARVTFYYPGSDGAGYTTAIGDRLVPWKTCAVDPRLIPYGSEVVIPGLGQFQAHDTGSAVVSRRAAAGFGHGVIVIDVCVKNAQEMHRMERQCPPLYEVQVL